MTLIDILIINMELFLFYLLPMWHPVGCAKPYKPMLTTTGRWSEASGSLRTWVDKTVAV